MTKQEVESIARMNKPAYHYTGPSIGGVPTTVYVYCLTGRILEVWITRTGRSYRVLTVAEKGDL